MRAASSATVRSGETGWISLRITSPTRTSLSAAASYSPGTVSPRRANFSVMIEVGRKRSAIKSAITQHSIKGRIAL